MTVDERMGLIQGALATHGEGFLAFLVSGQADYSDPEMLEQFTSSYGGWYPDRRAFLEHQLDSFDWRAETDDFLDELGLPPGALQIDEASVWQHCKEFFVLEERLGGIHVFTR